MPNLFMTFQVPGGHLIHDLASQVSCSFIELSTFSSEQILCIVFLFLIFFFCKHFFLVISVSMCPR